MAFIDDIRGFEVNFINRIRSTLEQARSRMRKNREFIRTCEELSRLSDRDLRDLGIARCDIVRIARDAAGIE